MMLIGWQFIDGVWYYFNPVAPMQTYFGDNINGWYYDSTNAGRPYGSMYSNEVTPDNYFVNVSGAYVK